MQPLIPIFLVSMTLGGIAQARDAESILDGSQVDALVEFADEQDGDIEGVGLGDDLADDDDDDAEMDEAANDDEDAGEDDSDLDFEFKLRGGYDSNYDETSDEEGSRFVELEASGNLKRQLGDTTLFGSAGASLLRLEDLSFKNRPYGYAQGAVRHVLAEGLAVQAAAGFEIDGTDDPVTLSSSLAAGVELLQPFGAFALRGKFDAENAVAERFPDEDVDAGAYDFYRPSIEGSVLLQPDSSVAPFAEVGLSRTVFAQRLPEGLTDDEDEVIPSPERDAWQATALVGLRLTLADAVVVKIGGRVYRRDFDAPGLDALVMISPEIEAAWELIEDVTLSASFERTLSEPAEFGSIARDVSALEVSLGYAPDVGLGMDLNGGYERVREIGIESEYDELSLELIASYRTAGGGFFELGVLHGWSFDRIGDDDYERLRVSGGGGYLF